MIEAKNLLSYFSEVVRDCREKLGVSQEELGVRAGLHRTYISDVECGARNLSLKTLCRLSTALGVSSSTLIKQAEKKMNPDAAFDDDDLFNNAPCGLHALDAEGRILTMNNTELNWLGYKREEIVGKMKVRELHSSKSGTKFEQYAALLQERGFIEVEYEYKRKNGEIMPVFLIVNSEKDAQGNIILSRTAVFDLREKRVKSSLS